MEHELPDKKIGHRSATQRVERERQRANADHRLPSAVGNRAFSLLVQRAGDRSQGAGPLDPEIANEIHDARSGGAQLDDATKADMEGHLGADLSSVRLHTGPTADQLNRSVQAEAFTTGNDIFFQSGTYNPGSTDGRRLLAHELTHVVQQASGEVGGESRVSDPDEPHEREAKAVGDMVAASQPATPTGEAITAGGPAVSREEMEEEDPTTVSPSVARQEEEEIPEEEPAG